jgi:glycolate oxidase FAD binding subunit
VLKLAARERWKLVPIGLGSKLSWCRPPERVDLALSTRRLAGVVAYEGGDGTLTARAGSTLESLASVARAGGNHLTPMVAHPERATLGGVLAAGQSGVDRARFGPARHHVLGMRVALADGSTARSGGRLVKNVTGYDLHRLYCGSHGTLCVILEASLRLFPAFEREARLTLAARDRAEAIALARRVEGLGVEPLAVRAENVLDPERRWQLHLLLAGRAPVVEWARARLLEGLPGARESASGFAEIRDLEVREGRWPAWRGACRPSELDAALSRIAPDAPTVVDPTVATIGAFVEGVAAERSELAAPAAAMMRRLKQSFDPDGLFAAGRFHTGL